VGFNRLVARYIPINGLRGDREVEGVACSALGALGDLLVWGLCMGMNLGSSVAVEPSGISRASWPVLPVAILLYEYPMKVALDESIK
jgi:hypothetical protein